MLKVNNLSFSYAKQPVLEDISFNGKIGEHVSIIGESGSGKSTLLNIIYGKHDLSTGKISWSGQQILGPAYNLVVGYDFMKYVSQEFDLMPFITVEENVGKHLSNFYPKEKKERTKELIKVVELEAFSKTKVKNLSGGQKQRVALARALANEPEILLLDEPFSHIDNFKKQSLRRSLFGYLREKKITCLVATHDKNDVLGFSDKMIVLNEGRIIANDQPERLYKNSKSKHIASFFGEFNLIKSRYLESNMGDENEDVIIYANQLKVARESKLKVTVKLSYFNGENYLIASDFRGSEILFYHSGSLEKDTVIFLELKNKKPK